MQRAKARPGADPPAHDDIMIPDADSQGKARLDLPPGPRGPAWLHSLRYMRSPYDYYARIRARYGNLVTLPTVNGTVVLAFTPELAREILAGREEDFVVGFGVDAVAPLLGKDSLLLLSGDRHRRDRRLMSPPFHGARMRSYGPIAQLGARRMMATWKPGDRLTARPLMQAVTLEVILRAVFGVCDDDELVEFAGFVREAVTEVNPLPLFFPFLQQELFGFGPWGRFMTSRRRLEALIQRRIDAARERGEPTEDILSRLVFARYEDGATLDDSALRSQLLTLIMAGHETTATALSWAVYELGRHPAWAKRLRDQVVALGPGADAADIAELADLEAFCCETLRVHPIVLEFFRTVRAPFTLGGFTIPVGLHLAGAIHVIHEDEDLYPEPGLFRPERFLERRFAPNEFAAFGGGHRHCLGAAFAMNEMKVILGAIVARAVVRLESSRPLRSVRRGLTIAPERDAPFVVEEIVPSC